jgi:hypothetical protein
VTRWRAIRNSVPDVAFGNDGSPAIALFRRLATARRLMRQAALRAVLLVAVVGCSGAQSGDDAPRCGDGELPGYAAVVEASTVRATCNDLGLGAGARRWCDSRSLRRRRDPVVGDRERADRRPRRGDRGARAARRAVHRR